jgi:xanthine/uracil permease
MKNLIIGTLIFLVTYLIFRLPFNTNSPTALEVGIVLGGITAPYLHNFFKRDGDDKT